MSLRGHDMSIESHRSDGNEYAWSRLEHRASACSLRGYDMSIEESSRRNGGVSARSRHEHRITQLHRQ
eukprot:5862778-Amphidinium_carterae.1